MPNLHDELSAGVRSGCIVCAYIGGLPPSNATEWRKELDLPVTVVPHASVVNALHRRNIEVTEASVRRHRKNHAAS